MSLSQRQGSGVSLSLYMSYATHAQVVQLLQRSALSSFTFTREKSWAGNGSITVNQACKETAVG